MYLNRPYIVAEISANHLGSFERCLRIVDAAKSSGADAVKLQTYTPDTMVADRDYFLTEGPWKGQRLFDLYCEAMTPLEWHADIFNYCRGIGITCFSTPFDETAVDFLTELQCPIYKIASFEITDIPLITKAAKTERPLILSTGMATKEEIRTAVSVARSVSDQSITLLKCTSAYPASAADANLATLKDMAHEFAAHVGISDHTKGIAVPIASILMGGTFIEKHLKLDDTPGPDTAFSLNPDEFAMMVTEVRKAAVSIGTVKYGPEDSEKLSHTLRRSAYAVRNIPKGERITEDSVKLRRPSLGIQPSDYPKILQRSAAQFIQAGKPITWDILE